ncbi:MAG: metal-dependent hydrolase [Acidobacteria bacterium]|jgi:inner membrane protein|nr:metal-dependent hydrolase [Acidobacteriota bacterium]
MPLPVGHALAGIAWQRIRPGLFFDHSWLDALFFIFVANLPDADFLPGLILGRPNLYHHGVFHSLGAALAVAAVGAGLFQLQRRRVSARRHGRFWAQAAMIFMLFYSHLLLDFFTYDLVAPYGLPLWWPFSGRYVIASQPFFINITRSSVSADFFSSIFNRHNLGAALREVMVIGGCALAVALFRCRPTRGLPGKGRNGAN